MTCSSRSQKGMQCVSKRCHSRAACYAARRHVLLASILGSAAVPVVRSICQGAAVPPVPASATLQPVPAAGGVNDGVSQVKTSPFSLPDYTVQGPLTVQKLPKLEHTCIRCFPACQMNKCLLRVDVWYPKGGPAIGQVPPYPLAIFSSGFLVSSEYYQSYARRLTSWGYTVMLYDKMETAVDPVDDELAAAFITELIDWAGSDPILRQVADPRRVYLLGHSRGAKVATLAAAQDTRVVAVCLIDPVDNTIYAPLGPGFPSATAALQNIPESRALPVAIIGGGVGGDCAPVGSNHDKFYAAAPGVAWEVVIADCGHFQFLDKQSLVQQAICGQGNAPDSAVRNITQGVMVAWGELATKATHSSMDTTNQSTARFRQHEASTSSELFLPSNGSQLSLSSSPSTLPNHSRIESTPGTAGAPSDVGFRGASCSNEATRETVMHNSSSRLSSSLAAGSVSSGDGKAGGDGRWVSSGSVLRDGSSIQGMNAQGGVKAAGLADLWPEVAQGVSERAEEILRRSGRGPAGRLLEVRYRLKQG